MDKTERISCLFSFDLAGQNKLLKDPGQVYIAKTINIGRFFDRFFRFWVDFWSIWGRFGEGLGGLFGDFGRLWGVQGVSWRRLRDVFSTGWPPDGRRERF